MTGVDNSPAAIEEARRQAGPNIEYVVGDAREYLRHHQFDAAFFHQSLHHFDELDDLMGIVRRAIRPGGLLYIDEYRRDYGGNLLAVVYPNLRKSDAFDRAVRRLIAMEEFFIAR